MCATFRGRRGLLVEFGPTIDPIVVTSVTCDARGMTADIVGADGEATQLSAIWQYFMFTADFWQISYANCRVVFDEEALRRHDAGEPFDIDEYL